MQYAVIYAIFFHVRIVVIASAVIVLAWLTVSRTEERKKEAQKIDDLPVLATHRSDTSAMLSGKVNGAVAHGSTQ